MNSIARGWADGRAKGVSGVSSLRSRGKLGLSLKTAAFPPSSYHLVRRLQTTCGHFFVGVDKHPDFYVISPKFLVLATNSNIQGQTKHTCKPSMPVLRWSSSEDQGMLWSFCFSSREASILFLPVCQLWNVVAVTWVFPVPYHLKNICSQIVWKAIMSFF